MSVKQNCIKDRLSKIHYSMFMLQYHWNIEYSLSVHLFYGCFYLLTSSCQMVTKSLTRTSNWKMQVCLSLYGMLVSTLMKGLIRFMFRATLSALQETIKDKLKKLVAHYWLTFLLIFCLYYMTFTITSYIITSTGFPY